MNWGNPYLSPDGSRVVYADYSGMIRSTFENTTGGDVPIDIFLRSMSPIETIGASPDAIDDLAKQPSDVHFTPNEEGSQKFVVRSEPSWSPSGEAIVWAEYLVDEQAGKEPTAALLKAYYFAQQSERLLVENLPLQPGKHRLANPQWGVDGILYPVVGENGNLRVLVYSRDGELRLDRKLDFPAESVWIATDTGFAIAVASKTEYLSLDEKTGELSPLPGVPELFNPLIGFGTWITGSPREQPEWSVGVGSAAYGLDGFASKQAFPTSAMGISFDGREIAYVNDSGSLVIIAIGGVISKISVDLSSVSTEPIVSLSWGPAMWRFAAQME